MKRLMSYTMTAMLAASLILLPAACSNLPPAGSPQQNNEFTDVNSVVNFDNDNLGFMRSFDASPDAAHVTFSIAEVSPNGIEGKGALLTTDRDGTMYIAIDLSSLLGESVSDLRTVEADIAVVNDYTDFYAVSGEVSIIDAEGTSVADGVWSVYLREKNPNIMRLELQKPLSPKPYNMLILSKSVDNAVAAGLEQSSLFISALRFFDMEEQLLPVNTDEGFNAPEGFGKPDRSNLMEFSGETAISGARGTSNGWGQAVALLTAKNGGELDAGLLKGSAVTVYYSSDSPPELILQSWTDGKPESAGWAKVAPVLVNNSGNIAQYSFEAMVTAFGTDDFEAFLDQLYVGDTGAELAVYSVTYSAGAGW